MAECQNMQVDKDEKPNYDVADHLKQTDLKETQQDLRLSVANVTAHAENERIYIEAKAYLGKFHYISGLPQGVQNIVAYHLNPKVDISERDYRGAATHLGFDVYFINNLKSKENPTEVLLQNCTNKTAVLLADILHEMKRADVLSAIVEYGKKHGAVSKERHVPLQRSVEETGDSSSLFCTEDSGHPSDMCSISWPGSGQSVAEFRQAMGIRRVASEQEDEFGHEEEFHSAESGSFWANVPGAKREKHWRDFEDALKKTCPMEVQKGQLVKFVCHTLGIDFVKRSESTVHVDNYRKMVDCFGPVKPEKDGCLQKMIDLMKDSSTNGKSWFAGRMSPETAEEALKDQEAGKFLVRYSESIPGFSLAIKTSNHGVQHYQIKNDAKRKKFQVCDKEFSTLKEMVQDGRENPLDSNTGELLSSACDNLPLNVMFKGYAGVQGAMPASSRGRGRGRGRGQPRKN